MKLIVQVYIVFRFILCDSDDIYLSLDVDNDDSAAEVLAEHQLKKKHLLEEIDFGKYVCFNLLALSETVQDLFTCWVHYYCF